MDETAQGPNLKDYAADVRVNPEDLNTPSGQAPVRAYDKIPSVGGVRGTKSSMTSADQSSDVGFAVTVSDNTATIVPGFVRFVNPKSDAEEVIKDWMPDGLDADPAPEYAVSVGQCIYALVVTDKRGEPTSVSIVVDSADKASTHYQPPPDEPDEVSAEGEYYYKIAQIIVEGGSLVAKQYQIGGPIIHTAALWEGKNVGDGAYLVFKQIEPTASTFDFRTLKQGGMDVSGAISILKDPESEPEDHITFKSISPKPSDAQIKVEASGGESVVIKGNDFELDIEFPGGGTLSVADGLVKAMTTPYKGNTFKVEVYNTTINFNTGSNTIEVTRDSSASHTIYFVDGIASTTEPEDFSGSAPIIPVAWITNDGGDGF
jgi:hypothetical protein